VIGPGPAGSENSFFFRLFPFWYSCFFLVFRFRSPLFPPPASIFFLWKKGAPPVSVPCSLFPLWNFFCFFFLRLTFFPPLFFVKCHYASPSRKSFLFPLNISPEFVRWPARSRVFPPVFFEFPAESSSILFTRVQPFLFFSPP